MNRMFLIVFAILIFIGSCGIDPSEDSNITVDETLCIGSTCRICAKTCKYDAVSFYGPESKALIDPLKCISCGDCISQCPTGAISGTVK
ncbi:MAG TPA: 4Fe-4S binding protein [bacterium]|jgi:heterodisulfide reductase subunit A-like polyferredoxin|nr:4Fe-4S binding protein [bacterium]HNW16088.1 4Fe-4S binding protein [bacterium]HNZ54840.1 4Fe-4S binding protein [bacterium]HOB71951.1 4Fe-4S binding protein [bacterium]HPY15796.1 4Fe-4S binding protein [bacterium]